LAGRKGIRPLKTEWWVAGMVVCLERGADLHMDLLMPLPLTVSCFSKIQIGFTFLIPAHLGNPGKGLLNVCVCDSICAICGHLWPFDNSEKLQSLSDDTAVCFQTEPLHTDSGADLHPAAAAATRREKRKL